MSFLKPTKYEMLVICARILREGDEDNAYAACLAGGVPHMFVAPSSSTGRPLLAVGYLNAEGVLIGRIRALSGSLEYTSVEPSTGRSVHGWIEIKSEKAVLEGIEACREKITKEALESAAFPGGQKALAELFTSLRSE